MSPNAQKVFEEALQLAPHEREWLVEALLIRDEGESGVEVSAAWDEEIKRRLDEIDSGVAEMLPGDQVRAELIAKLSPEARARLAR